MVEPGTESRCASVRSSGEEGVSPGGTEGPCPPSHPPAPAGPGRGLARLAERRGWEVKALRTTAGERRAAIFSPRAAMLLSAFRIVLCGAGVARAEASSTNRCA